MKIKLGSGLVPLNMVSLILLLVVVLVPAALAVRIVLGLPFVLLFPGYVMMLVLAPRKHSISGVTRLALSIGLSLALVTLIVLVLNFTPLKLEPDPIIGSIFGLIVVVSGAAWYRLKYVPASEQLCLGFTLSPLLPGKSPLERILAVVVVVASLGLLGTIVYKIAEPTLGTPYTEFYMLGLDGTPDNYPTDLVVGDTGQVTLVVVNHEHRTMTYDILVYVDGQEIDSLSGIVLQNEETRDYVIPFTPLAVNSKTKVQFQLVSGSTMDQQLDLWVNVSDNSTGSGPHS